VYEVERDDGQFVQRAVLKVIAHADAGTWQAFHNERQILAHLDHPGIARLIDGSLLEGGTPFMVMEYIDGAPIDTWSSYALARRWCTSSPVMSAR